MRPLEPRLRVVTLLTTDAVSSTQQQLRLGDHRSDELRRERDALVNAEIALCDGDVIKSTGDGTLAAFASPSRAISCAVGVQRALSRRNAAETERIELRIGLATGEVIFESGDVFGRGVIESTRITAQAQAGEILCCGLTRQLAAPRSTCPIEFVGEADLKGFDVPVPVHRVGWSEAFEPIVPLPAAIAGRRQPFVGRQSVLAAVTEIWASTVATNTPRLLVLGGEPGVGKTSVLFRVAHDVFRSGGSVLYGRCRDDHVDSLRPIREALSHYVRARPGHLSEELGSGRAELARLVPELADLATGAVPDASADHRSATAAMLDAVVQWLATASRVRPILFLVDDAEWLDSQTGELVRRVGEEHDLGPLLLAVAHRDREPMSTGELANAVSQLRGAVHTMRLSGLSSEESSELVTIVRPSSEEVADRLHHDSGGNPLYLLELLRAAPSADGQSLERVPKDATELVLRRVDRLGEPAVELMEVGAVLGREFEVAAVERMLGWPAAETQKVLDVAIRHELIHETASSGVRFEFAHAIVREAVYQRLTKVRRVAFHRRAAVSLEELLARGRPIPAGEIAHHYVEAAPSGNLEPALSWCRRAADAAIERLAYEEAGRWLDAGLALYDELGLDQTSVSVELLLERAVASQWAGQRGTRDRFLRAAAAAHSRGDGGGLVKVALAFDRGFFAMLGRTDERRIDILREAISLTSVTTAERSCLIAQLASELTWDDPDGARFDLSDEALELARTSGDHECLLRVLSLRPPTIWSPETFGDVVASVDELGVLAETIDNSILQSRYLTFRFGVDAEAGAFAGLPDVVERLGEMAWFLRRPDVLWHAALLRANLALLGGRLPEARAAAVESLELGQRARQSEALFFYAAVELEIRRLCGGLDEMLPQLELAFTRAAAGGYSATRFLYDAGRPHLAREDYVRAVRTPWVVPKTINGGLTGANLAYLAAKFEDVKQAEHLLSVLAPYSGRFFQGITSYHVTDYYRGMLAATVGRYDEAADLLRRAVDLHDEVGAPLHAAESRLEWARLALLDAQWTGPGPHTLVDSAIAAAEDAGASALSARARELRSRL